ncbi:MAG: hypothetical protein JWN62_3859 [Acidimicrobiales bacterium]|nr:hypothetical protein [Acidimicrobiales bacterium]
MTSIDVRSTDTHSIERPTTRRRPARRRAVAASTAVLAVLASCSSGSDSAKKLPLGTEAVVAYVQAATTTASAVNTTVAVDVLDVEVGTLDELTAAGFDVGESNAGDTPYYVDVRYSNRGTGDAVRNLSVGMEDSKGNSVPTTLVFDLDGAPFDRCKDVSTGDFAPGDTYQSCTLFLVPKGTTLDRVRFVSQSQDATITFTDWNAG